MTPPTTFRPAPFARALQRLRDDVRLTQRALARTSGVSHTAISALETGDAPAPHPSMLAKLARGLATSGLGNVDEARAEEAYLALMRAAGYVPPPAPSDEDAQRRRLIEQTLGDRAGAEFVETVIAKMRGRSNVDFDTTLGVLDVLWRSMPPTDR